MTEPAPSSQPLPHLAMRAIDIAVGDIDATMAFYSGIVPLRELRRFAVPAAAFGPELCAASDGEVQIAVVAAPTGILNLLQFPGAPSAGAEVPVEGPGYTHICYQSAASDPALSKFIDRGLSLISRCDRNGVDLGGYGVRYAYGRDLENRMIEVEILDQPRRAEASWIAHIANCAHDHAAMQDFYRLLLGKEPYRTLPASCLPTYDLVSGIDDVEICASWFRIRNFDIELWTYTSPPTPVSNERRKLDTVGYGGFALEVVDMAAEAARLTGLGIPLVGPEIDLGGWKTQYAADPEGNLFSVQQRITASPEESGLAFEPLQ